ncbi:HK97-gp10 family putative phage morphogenesis protein [Nitrososphaera viennensis]|uniref:HK97 gp10 family phage protein n=2 Tax=Nitrososphaera viennensis TaxID=1034015 RepID=A0A060HKC0_9ARCH|nr:HK97-gp10 family putative phage morphogenesis protein [Nitrososphaera viennensis]AIC16954.1 hypothetical protein NVIE_026820 [Nitrososphaera viennensis EN76]UVS68857.1 hypothetical protein NWT39_13230 [Nitrososphaera viennensis]CBX88964.1 putative protein involved on virion morphogenensis; HK97 gp10-like/Mu gpG-like [Nitrososphaera phage Pro-Nvie1]
MLSVKGVSEAMRILDEVSRELAGGDIAGASLEAVGKAALDLANAQTPVDTGLLVSNNKMEMKSKAELVLYNDTPYAGHVHYGTSRMHPRPFFYPALRFLEERFPRLYAQEVGAFVHKTVSLNSAR